MDTNKLKDVTIEFDARTSKFEVVCPFWANDLIHDIPSRRWDKKRRAWQVPPTKKNIEFIEDKLIKPGYVNLKPEARDAIARYKVEVSIRTKGTGFPHWYKFKIKPMKHQRAALNKLYGLHCFALHMDRRTGKTKVIIDFNCALRMEGKIQAWLVVVRLSVRRNWVKELEAHAPIPYQVFLPNTDKLKDFERWMVGDYDFPIMVVGLESLSNGNMYKLCERFLLKYAKSVSVVDESQHISNHKAIRSERCISMGRMTEYRETMTGTPIRTGPMNLYSQYEFMDPNIIGIGDFYAFRNRYAIMGGYRAEIRPGVKQAVEIVGYQNLEELATLVAPFTFEVRKEDVLDFPPKQYEIRTVELTKEQRALYDIIKKNEAYEWAGSSVVLANVLGVMLRLQQVAGGHTVTQRVNKKGKFEYDPHDIIPWKKNPKIMEMMEVWEEEPDAPRIIWAAFIPEIDDIQSAFKHVFPKRRLGEVTGRINEDARWKVNRDFQSGVINDVVGNVATGGEGLDFFRAESMIYYNNTQSLIDREQSEDRGIKDGNKHSLLITDLVAERTVDETIIESLRQKLNLSDYVRQRIRNAAQLLDGTAGQA